MSRAGGIPVVHGGEDVNYASAADYVFDVSILSRAVPPRPAVPGRRARPASWACVVSGDPPGPGAGAGHRAG